MVIIKVRSLFLYLTKKQRAQNPGEKFPEKLSIFFCIWSGFPFFTTFPFLFTTFLFIFTTFPFLSTTFPFLLYLISSVNRTRKSDGDGISDRRPNGDDMFIEGIIYSSETIYLVMFLFIGGVTYSSKTKLRDVFIYQGMFLFIGGNYFFSKTIRRQGPRSQ